MEISFWWLDSRQCKQGDGNKWQIPFEEFARLSKEWQVLCVPLLVCLPGLQLPEE